MRTSCKAMKPRSQIDVFEEIIVDSFAGGGGASTGIELATGRGVDVAINHDPDAILMHRTNHPYTVHYQASVWDVDPAEVCAGRPVGLLWAVSGLQTFQQGEGWKASRQAHSRAGVDRPALGGDRSSASHHPGKRGGVPNLGPRPERQARQIKGGRNLPPMGGAAAKPRL